jgi:hypothetical protein
MSTSEYTGAAATAPASQAASVTPSDSTALRTTRGIYVGGGGTLVVTMLGVDSTFINVPSGTILPIQVQKVKLATTATFILALY